VEYKQKFGHRLIEADGFLRQECQNFGRAVQVLAERQRLHRERVNLSSRDLAQRLTVARQVLRQRVKDLMRVDMQLILLNEQLHYMVPQLQEVEQQLPQLQERQQQLRQVEQRLEQQEHQLEQVEQLQQRQQQLREAMREQLEQLWERQEQLRQQMLQQLDGAREVLQQREQQLQQEQQQQEQQEQQQQEQQEWQQFEAGPHLRHGARKVVVGPVGPALHNTR
jgi:uncharacterized membrane protein YccC